MIATHIAILVNSPNGRKFKAKGTLPDDRPRIVELMGDSTPEEFFRVTNRTRGILFLFAAEDTGKGPLSITRWIRATGYAAIVCVPTQTVLHRAGEPGFEEAVERALRTVSARQELVRNFAASQGKDQDDLTREELEPVYRSPEWLRPLNEVGVSP